MKIFQIIAYGLFSLVLFDHPTSNAQSLEPIRILLIGDSTLAPKNGYGDEFCKLLKAEVDCINLGKNGRSSGSYIAEGSWQKATAIIKNSKPVSKTYVLIEFAHNDQPGKPGRSTDLKTEFPANLKRYILESRALGAYPILSTPLTRREFINNKLVRDLEDWAQSTRKVAQDEKVPLIDLLQVSAQTVEQMGQVQADTLAVEPEGGKDHAFDHTHVGLKGAQLFSKMVALLFKNNISELFPYFNTTQTRPHLSELDSRLFTMKEVLGYAGFPGQEKPSPWIPELAITKNAEFIVDANAPSDGTHHFRTIQGAVDQIIKINKSTHSKDRLFIQIQPGVYQGPVYIPSLGAPISFIGLGDSPDKTIIRANLDASIEGQSYARQFDSLFANSDPDIQSMYNSVKQRSVITTFGSATLWTQNKGFQASNLTIENNYKRVNQDCASNCSGSKPTVMHQAVALMVDGADQSVFDRIRLIGLQDTLYLNNQNNHLTSRSFFTNSYIEGDVDFIFGDATAFFHETEIKSVGDRKDSYVGAPSTNVHSRYGFVFDHCQFTHEHSPNALAGNYRLARQWFHNQKCTPYAAVPVSGYSCLVGNSDSYAQQLGTIRMTTLQNVGKMVVMNSSIGKHISETRPWSDWNQLGKVSFRPVQLNQDDYLQNLSSISPVGQSGLLDQFDKNELPWFLAEFNNHTE